MENTMTVVGTYLNELEAQMAQGLLKSEGIIAVVQKDNCGGMYPQLALLRGVKILVEDADEKAALQVLEAENQKPSCEAWTCTSCGEKIEQGFSACWHCGQENDC